jgi:cold-inducible RNA-binding protein
LLTCWKPLSQFKSTGLVAFRLKRSSRSPLESCDLFLPALHSIQRIEKEMGTKLYVGNLSFRTTSEELRDAFAAVGTVESASVIEDRDTGRSRGFAFVEMATPEEAAAAIEQFNGKDFGGRNLTVNEAKPRADRGGRGGGYAGGRGGYGGGGGDRGGDRGGYEREPRW